MLSGHGDIKTKMLIFPGLATVANACVNYTAIFTVEISCVAHDKTVNYKPYLNISIFNTKTD